MKFARLLLVFASLALVYPHLTAGKLDDFKENTKKEEKKKEDSSSGSKAKADAENSIAWDILAGIFKLLWYNLNSAAEYDAYPFADAARNYIRYTPQPTEVQAADGKTFVPEDKAKRWYILPEVSAQYVDTSTYAYNLNLHSRFAAIIGPYGSFRQYRQNDGQNLNYYQVGLDLPVFQFPVVNWSVYLGYAGFSGILERKGFSAGMELAVLAIKPVCLNLRFGNVNLGTINYGEFAVRLGFFVGRAEIFAGYHWLTSETARLDGAETGVRAWL